MSYRVAMIGAGGIAHAHMKAIQAMSELELAGVADLNPDRVKEATSTYGGNGYDDYRKLVLEEKPDIAVITLPHFLHLEAAVWCAQQGAHLMLEKPMALDTSECESIIEAANRHQVQLMVGHTQHYIAENIKAKEIIRSGKLGKLIMICDRRHIDYFQERRPDWFLERDKSGGGIFMNLGSHSIDKIQWLTDSRVTRVKAAVTHFGSRGDVEGSGIAYVETDSGLPATICQSGYGGVVCNETELLFTGGMMKLQTGGGLWISEQGEYKPVEVDRSKPPFVLQFEDLIRSIQTGAAPECSGEYGKSVIHAVLSMYASHEDGVERQL